MYTLLLVLTLQALDAHPGLERGSVITHVEQPEGITPTQYLKVWPDLEPFLTRLGNGDAGGVETDLLHAANTGGPSAGALNLLAQVQRQNGKLEQALASIDKAISLDPKQHLHYFQRAMIFFAHFEKSSGQLERWNWHKKTKEAYSKAFELDPTGIPYRYYLTYAYLKEPRLVGGNKDEALRLAQQGLDMGLKEFLVVRADVRRLRGEIALAYMDYDESMRLGIFKLRAFLDAGHLALERKDFDRAKKYFEYAVHCRPDSPLTYEGLGDYYMSVHQPQAAAQAYQTGLSVAREKLGKIKPSS